MRAVRSVINAAGINRINQPYLSEEQVLLKALESVNMPKFINEDVCLFQNILKDIFRIQNNDIRGEVKENNSWLSLQKIIDVCKTKNMGYDQDFLGKINYLYETISVRHGLMLVGPPGGGKT